MESQGLTELASRPHYDHFVSRHDVYSALKLAHAQRLVWCQGVAVPRVPRLSLRTPATVEYVGRGYESITGHKQQTGHWAPEWLVDHEFIEMAMEPISGRDPAVYRMTLTDNGRGFLDELAKVVPAGQDEDTSPG